MTPSRTYIGKALFAAKAGQDSVQDWRLYVLNTVLGALLIFGTLVAVPSIVTLLYQGLWPAAIADVVILAIGFALWRSPAASFLLRSWGLCTILYLLGFALLFMMGPTSQIYLMMSPAMAAILLGPWPAAWMLVGSSITLFCVGYLGYSNFQIPGLNVDPLAVWFTITLNFVFVNAVITLSISLLIRGLETSFARVAEASRVKSEFINTSLDSIISIDAQGRVTEWSRQAELTFGWSFTEVRGQLLHDLIIPQRHREGHVKGMAHYMATGAGPWLGQRIEIFALRRDGVEIPIELAISPIVTPQGTSFSAFIRDVTVRKQEQAALVEARLVAENASRAKSEVLANMSHEIRTPMNGVIGMVDILQASPLLPEQQRMLGTISNSALALLNIINDILDFSKIEAGKLEVESIPMHLGQLADDGRQLMAIAAQSSAVALSVFVAPELPQWAYGDPMRLRQVLINLLGNAIKFTPNLPERPAHVELKVEPCSLADGAPGMRLCVRDNGIGMDAEVVAKLFQPFRQGDESTARKFGGTGLGLSISQRLVELMGGRIKVTSTPGRGSDFSVELPLHPSAPGPMRTAHHDPAQHCTAPTAEAAMHAGCLILLAEDNEINRDVMEEQLRLLGYTCEMAEDGAIALQMWQANPDRYALLLSDCHMPNMDGFALTEAIRATEPAGTRLPIIAVTANAMQGEAQRCLERGMDDYLSKPLRLTELGQMLAKWLPQTRTTAQPPAPHGLPINT